MVKEYKVIVDKQYKLLISKIYYEFKHRGIMCC